MCCRSVGSVIVGRTQPVVSYAMRYSRSHDAVIRVYDTAGNVIETHEHKGDFKECVKKFRRPSLERKKRMAALKLNLRWRGLAPTEATPPLRENYVIAPVAGKKIRSRARSLLIVQHCLRRGFTQFELCAHFL